MYNPNRNEFIWLVMIVLISAALACNIPRGEGELPVTPQFPENQIQKTEPVNDLPPDDTQTPADVQTPTREPTEIPSVPDTESGLSRANPFPIDTEVETPYWDFKVLEFYRGEDAWQLILADNPDSPPAPQGKEYALIKMWLHSKNPDPEEQNFSLHDIFVTGDLLQFYGDKLIKYPAPEIVYSDIYTDEIFEGWIDVLVASTDGNLILVFDRREYIDGESTPREVRYIALEQGATIAIPAELDAIVPNNLGMEPENLAQVGQTVIGEDWEVTILEVVHGQEALDIVMQMNEESDPPEEGMEYIAFRTRIRRISTEDMIDYRPGFWGYAQKEGAEGWETIPEPRINNKHAELYPIMSFYFFPGLESEGWFVLTAPVDQTPQIAQFDLGGDFPDQYRYFQLTP